MVGADGGDVEMDAAAAEHTARAGDRRARGRLGPAGPSSANFSEVVAVWGILAVACISVFSTYARLDPADLYHVSHGGLAGGASRTLVFLGFPVAFAVAAIVGTVFGQVRERAGTNGHRLLGLAALAAVSLCATAALPGVVDQADLDARPVNAIAAVGVLGGLLLTLAATLHTGVGRPLRWHGADWVRVSLAAIATFLALPWLAAEVGFGSDQTPILTSVFLEYDLRGPAAVAPVPAVHPGDHHGTDGLLLLFTVLLLSRPVLALPRSRLRTVLVFYLSLGLLYGVANAAQDWWLEQLVKRDLVAWEFPHFLEPELSLQWALLLAGSLMATIAINRFHRASASPAAAAPSGVAARAPRAPSPHAAAALPAASESARSGN